MYVPKVSSKKVWKRAIPLRTSPAGKDFQNIEEGSSVKKEKKTVASFQGKTMAGNSLDNYQENGLDPINFYDQ